MIPRAWCSIHRTSTTHPAPLLALIDLREQPASGGLVFVLRRMEGRTMCPTDGNIFCRPVSLICSCSAFPDHPGGCRPGMYAIEVVGELPVEVLEFLQEKRIPYQCKAPDSTMT